MEYSQLLQTVLAFIFVLGLMFITLWLIKLCQQKSILLNIGKHINKKAKIKIIERHRIDMKNSVVLMQYDNIEYLTIIGEGSHLLLQQTKVKE